MLRIDRSTVVYTGACALIALTAAALWVFATGQLRIPGSVIPVLAVGSALITTGIERTAHKRRLRRTRPGRTQHRKLPATTKDNA